ncbi:MAG: hypothetical protein AAF385_15350 [Pseudomonadota bacterium]
MNAISKKRHPWSYLAWALPTLAVVIMALPSSAKADHRFDGGDLILGAALAYALHSAYDNDRHRYYSPHRYHRVHSSYDYWPRRHYHSSRAYRRGNYCEVRSHRNYRNYYYDRHEFAHNYRKYKKKKRKYRRDRRDRRDRRHNRRHHRHDH